MCKQMVRLHSRSLIGFGSKSEFNYSKVKSLVVQHARLPPFAHQCLVSAAQYLMRSRRTRIPFRGIAVSAAENEKMK